METSFSAKKKLRRHSFADAWSIRVVNSRDSKRCLNTCQSLTRSEETNNGGSLNEFLEESVFDRGCVSIHISCCGKTLKRSLESTLLVKKSVDHLSVCSFSWPP